MSLAKVAIVGRPNVGKSSIFNWLAGIRLAIVDAVAGVTRDRQGFVLEYDDRYFEIIDTGGIGINDVDDLDEEIEEQIRAGIEEADILLFVVDARDGLVGLDQTITQRLRAISKPIVLVANKCDGENYEILAHDFSRLGLGSVVAVSAKNNRHRESLLQAIVAVLPADKNPDQAEIAEPEMRFAIVGRRNVGKSTFINALTDSPRMIVSSVAGTTRDSVNVRFEMDGKSMIAIDTPGLKRGKSIRTDVDFYSDHRAHRSIRHADVVLMFFDCSQQISKVDQQLCNYIERNFKPCLFVVNKWDLMAEHMATERWADYLHETFPNMAHSPIAFITAQEGRNIRKLMNHAQMLFKQSLQRVTTGELNRLVRQAIARQAPPVVGTRRLKILYATQIGVQPPTIVLKVNDRDAISPTWQRFLLNSLRDELPFGEIPIRLIIEDRSPESADALARRRLAQAKGLDETTELDPTIAFDDDPIPDQPLYDADSFDVQVYDLDVDSEEEDL